MDGTWKPPADNLESAFSKANWDDRMEPTGPKGEYKLKKRASVFMPEVNSLTYEQWDDIIVTALNTRERRSVKKRKPEVIEIDDASDNEEDILVDPRYAPKSVDAVEEKLE